MLRAFRERRLLTQEQVAERAGVSVRTVRRLESERGARARGDSVNRLADALRLDATDRQALIAAAVRTASPSPVPAAPVIRAVSPSPAPADGVVADRPFGGAAVPAQLPAGPRVFVGRDADLRRLDSLALPTAGDPQRLVIVTGSAGVGKSALVFRWGHVTRSSFPDGHLFADLRGFSTGPGPSAREVMAGFLHALGVPPARIPTDLATQQGLYRSLLADRRMLIVLDNVATTEHLVSFLPGRSPSTVIVTSRLRLPAMAVGHDADRLDLSGLTGDAAEALLRALVGSLRDGSGGALAEMARLCTGLPLALRICAANLVGEGGIDADADAVVTRHLRRLQQTRLDALSLTGPEHLAVRAALRPSYTALPPQAARLFRMLGAAPGADLSAEVAEALLDATAAVARQSTAALVDLHLLIRNDIGRLQMHDLVRLYAAERGAEEDPQADRRQAIRRLREFYLVTTAAASARAWPNDRKPVTAGARGLTFGSATDALAWLDRERPTLLATVRHAAADDGDPAALPWAVAMAVELQSYLWANRHTVDWLGMVEAIAAAAEHTDDLRLQARLANQLGIARWSGCDFEGAIDHFNRGLELNTRLGRAGGVAANLSNLAALYRIIGRPDMAVDTGRRALDLYQAEGDMVGWANTGLTIAMVDGDAGRLDRALTMCRRVLMTYREHASVDGEASALLELARTYRRLGRSAEAVAAADAVLHLPPDALSATNRASAVASLARFGRPNTARQLIQLSHLADEWGTTIGDRQIEAEVSLAAGVVAARLDRHGEALDHFRHAGRLATDIGDVHIQIDATCGAAVSAHRLRPDAACLDDLHDAWELAGRNGLRVWAGECLATRAVLALDHGDHATAIADARAASAIRDETGMAFGFVDGASVRRLSSVDRVPG